MSEVFSPTHPEHLPQIFIDGKFCGIEMMTDIQHVAEMAWDFGYAVRSIGNNLNVSPLWYVINK